MKKLVFVLCLGLVQPVGAQEQLGIRQGRYAGVNALWLNPSELVNMPYRWDTNVLEISQFFDNNYLFVENFRLLDLRQKPEALLVRSELENGSMPPSGSLVLDFYRGGKGRRAFRGSSLSSVGGPAVGLRLANGQAIGLYTRMRAAVHFRQIPTTLGYYEYNLQPFDMPLEIAPFDAAAMAWSEVGFNYARSISGKYGDWNIGATLKWLSGYEALFLHNNQTLELTQLRDNRLRGSAADFRYGLASSAFYGNAWRLQRNGMGLAMDIGASASLGNYPAGKGWQLGVSLLDVGAIRFGRQAQAHRVRTDSPRVVDLLKLEPLLSEPNLNALLQDFSEQILGAPEASLQRRALTMSLPTALSIQTDIALRPTLFVNATIVQSLPIQASAPQRNNLLAFVPRYETRWLAMGVPISWLDWQKLRSGFFVRAGYLVLGTDDARSIFHKDNFDSTDFYMALKINGFSIKKDSYAKNRQAKQSSIRCPKW